LASLAAVLRAESSVPLFAADAVGLRWVLAVRAAAAGLRAAAAGLRAADGLLARVAPLLRLRDAVLADLPLFAGLRLVLRDCCRVVAMTDQYPALSRQLSGAMKQRLPERGYAAIATCAARSAQHDANGSTRTP
jgi:hypothetical protein